MREDYDKCIVAGMDEVHAKPINFSKLFSSMEEIVPSGAGNQNTQFKISIDSKEAIDFSALNNVIDYEMALKTWRVPDVYAKSLV